MIQTLFRYSPSNMPTRLILAFIILLAYCSSQTFAFEVQEGPSPSLINLQANAKANADTSYCPWIYMTAGSKGPFEFGLLVNSTLMTISSQVAYTKFNYECPFRVASMLMHVIPKHPLLINDPLTMFAHTTNKGQLEWDTFMIINGTKWPILGGMNQTLSMGVKEEMIAQTTESFLNNYPTGMYLDQPY